ncbi:MAG: Pilus assembly protein PilW [Herminiimonas sp.]|nr:Pilus assembly protein PilW [Herminiimonas sp.]
MIDQCIKSGRCAHCIVIRQSGLSIVELMVSLAVGMLVVMAATALLLSSKAGYTAQDEGERLQETGRYALEAITRAVRQAAYENWDREATAIVNTPTVSANLAGLDDRSLKETEIGIDAPLSKAINGSDVLAVRFIGAGAGPNGDGVMLNCAGFGVAEPVNLETDRGWSIFYVAADKSGEPELRCKYYGKSSWSSEAIARGVESFQVLYGIDTDADGLPNRFLNAAGVNELDNALVLAGANAIERAIDRNNKTHWKKVVVVKVALLVRGSQNARSGTPANRYDLFGKDYADVNAAGDIGTRINEETLPAAARNRLRKVFASTIQLRSAAAGSGT